MKSTKERVMDFLIENSNAYISGEVISEKLGISRASIWKHINTLKNEGYMIESKSKLGYKYCGSEKNLTPIYEIKHSLTTDYIGKNIHYFKSIDSTNTYANKIANNSEEGTVVISDEQTNGKGRIGKKWVSKLHEGIFFSLILKPEIPIFDAPFITQVAGASLVNSFKDLGIDVTIKWPNDIILNGKKISGILTEMNAEIEKVNYVIVGIGINLYNQEFDKTISNVATSLLSEGYMVEKSLLISSFFTEFEKLYEEFKAGNKNNILEILRKKSAVLGRDIYILRPNSDKEKVFAKDIDGDGNLIVVDKNGNINTVFTGEISIRGLESYI